MKKIHFVIGVIVGAILFGGVSGISSNIIAMLSEQNIYVDGERVEMLAYHINGNNFVRLRDIGSAVGFGVTFDEATGRVHIDSNSSYVDEDEVILIRYNHFRYIYEWRDIQEIFDYGFTLNAGADIITLQAELYYHMLRSLFNIANADVSIGEGRTIALDLSNMQFEHTDILIEMIEEFCRENGYTLLFYTFSELVDKGYIDNPRYDWNGIIFVYFDAEWDVISRPPQVTDTRIRTNVWITWASLGGVGAEFEANLIDGRWTIRVVDEMFI